MTYNTDVFSLLSCGFIEGGDARLHRKDSAYVIEYVLSGEEIIESPETLLTVSAGGTIIINAAEECVLYHKPKGFRAIYIEMGGTLPASLYDTFGQNSVVYRYLPLYDKLFSVKSLSERYFAGDFSVTEEICTLLFSVLLASSSPQTSFDGKLTAEKIRDYIKLKMFETVELDDVAKAFGVTKIHIIRVFRDVYGMSPMQYLKEERLLYSEQLLTSTDMSIKTIAELIGYSGTQHFTNLFRDRFGTSPGKYRNNSKQK